MIKHPTRESWLMAATELFRPWFAAAGTPLVHPVRTSIGFPSRGALSTKRRRIGECWSEKASNDGHSEILISPLLDDPLEIAATLNHELCHAALGTAVGHRKPFAKLAEKMGLQGPWTATSAGPDFRMRFAGISRQLGELPHSRLNVQEVLRRKPDNCRQLKAECPECGYVARISRKWMTEAGLPICPTDGSRFVAEGVEPKDDDG